MTVANAMATANNLRPNMIDDKIKAGWLYELEGKIAEMMGAAPPVFDFPAPRDLLLEAPYEGVYAKYLVAMIDYYQGETDLYAMDIELFNREMREAGAAWRRAHPPKEKNRWEGLV